MFTRFFYASFTGQWVGNGLISKPNASFISLGCPACQGRLKSINNAIKALMVAWKSAFCWISDIIDIKVLSFRITEKDKDEFEG